ncbi:hypothetical protein B9Z55_001277 [Caenorhabditis nigoni]|uniref:Uncharacterized protein n=1 Tax=Caenorhabditis nigoni TaxID=1611254 RepID=A0A2G5VF11_9PELO|nr:hypothetical protein B9Z55_001277 [Caenorhabditis nigoni]
MIRPDLNCSNCQIEVQMILFILLQFAIIVHLVLVCGGGKKKKSSGASKEPAKSKMNAPQANSVKSAVKDPEQKAPEEPAAPPPKPPSPPKPVVEDTKVAEMMPESVKEDEMKGGIKLPAPPKNLKCEADVAPKEAKEKEKEKEAKKDEIM